MELKVRQLEVFKAVMDTGSVTAAAARLQCTQPAVSVALAKFEEASGLTLFDRTRGRFAPTPEGEALYEEVERAMTGLDRIASTARDLREGRIGHLRMAADGAPSVTFLPKVIAEFQRVHPDVSIDLHVRSSKEVVTRVGSQQMDLGIVEMPVHWPGVSYEPFTQPCVCLMTADHPLAARSSVTPADLERETVVGVLDHHPVQTQLRDSFAQSGHRLTTRVNGYYFATCRNLVRHGAGLAIVDAMNGDDLGDGVVARPFVPTIRYEMAIVHPAKPGPSPLALAFLDALRDGLDAYRIA